jgi:hypothetical protein
MRRRRSSLYQGWRGNLAHPNSPTGGSGPGFSRAPYSQEIEFDHFTCSAVPNPDWPAGGLGAGPSPGSGPGGDSWFSSRVPHPHSPVGQHLVWQLELPQIDFDDRSRAVYEAVRLARNYVPEALREATGYELHGIIQSIIPGLLIAIRGLAVTTTAGAVAGFALGAAPGAMVGASLGFDVGLVLFDFLGLAFLIAYIGGSAFQGAAMARQAVDMAWHSVESPGMQQMIVRQAARKLAFAAGLAFRGVLQGIVAFLLAKGSAGAANRLPEVVAKLRASKLDPGFAEWLGRNWKGLIEDPRLKSPEVCGLLRSEGRVVGEGLDKTEIRGSHRTEDNWAPEGEAIPATAKVTVEKLSPRSAGPREDLRPGTPEHRAARWKEYQERGGEWNYERWSRQYTNNMRNVSHGLERETEYRTAMGGVSQTFKTPYTNRQVDIFVEEDNYMGQLKTGKESLTEENILAIKKDAWLVQEGNTVEHILEQGASEPYLKALDDSGIRYTITTKTLVAAQ